MRPAAAIRCLLLAALLLGGCATRVPERDRGVYVGSQGGSSAVVFAGPGVVQRLGVEDPTWEDGRRNFALGYQNGRVVTATDQWPVAPRPDLDNARRLQLRNRAGSIIYFNRYGPWLPYY